MNAFQRAWRFGGIFACGLLYLSFNDLLQTIFILNQVPLPYVPLAAAIKHRNYILVEIIPSEQKPRRRIKLKVLHSELLNPIDCRWNRNLDISEAGNGL